MKKKSIVVVVLVALGFLAFGDFSGGNIASGIYVPTLTNGANVSASTADTCQYIRIGNTVTVSGKFDVDPTITATLTAIDVSLPIASAFTADEDAAGVAMGATGVADNAASMSADAANDRVDVTYYAIDVTNHSMYFTFTYRVK